MNSARATLACGAQIIKPMAIETVARLGENKATTTMVRSRPGSTWKTSISRDKALSILPPKYPAAQPTAVPIPAASSPAVSPTTKVDRPPWSMARPMSRPR